MKLDDINSKMKFSAIYKWENLINGKVYIGQTKNVARRFKPYAFSNPHFEHAVNYYGIENFEIALLETHLPLETLDAREEYWIEYYDSCNKSKGYNVYPHVNSPRGIKWSAETREKILSAKLAKHRHTTDEGKCKMREAMKAHGKCTPIVQLDFFTGEVIATYPSISEASRKSGCDKSCIIKVLQGKNKKTKGYTFKEAI